MAILDEVTFLLRLLSDNWSSACTTLVSSGEILNAHVETPKFIDIRSIAPNEGRRVDADAKSVVLVYEDGNSVEYPTIDYLVRNESYNMTIHIRVLHRRDFPNNEYSRDRLQALYRVTRYILENNSQRPKVYVGGNSSNNVEDSAEIVKLLTRSEANDRGKRLLGYKLSIEMKRMARSVT
jgi:hypothetical protein|tara:strand:- start:886 stop:1425 length:540 start_codon:yes stop_codon:yes gene_type:complete